MKPRLRLIAAILLTLVGAALGIVLFGVGGEAELSPSRLGESRASSSSNEHSTMSGSETSDDSSNEVSSEPVATRPATQAPQEELRSTRLKQGTLKIRFLAPIYLADLAKKRGEPNATLLLRSLSHGKESEIRKTVKLAPNADPVEILLPAYNYDYEYTFGGITTPIFQTERRYPFLRVREGDVDELTLGSRNLLPLRGRAIGKDGRYKAAIEINLLHKDRTEPLPDYLVRTASIGRGEFGDYKPTPPVILATTTTNELGEFVFYVEPGRYRLEPANRMLAGRENSFGEYAYYVHAEVTSKNDLPVELVVELGVTIRGRVTLNGKHLFKSYREQYYGRDIGGNLWEPTLTRQYLLEDATFDVHDRPPARYQFTFVIPSGVEWMSPVFECSVTSEVTQMAGVIDLSRDITAYRLAGYVAIPEGSTSFPNSPRLYLKKDYASTRTSDESLEAAEQKWWVRSEDGRFVIPYVLPGDYVLTVSCPGYADRSYRISVSRDQTEMRLRLGDVGATLKISIDQLGDRLSESKRNSYLRDVKFFLHDPTNGTRLMIDARPRSPNWSRVRRGPPTYWEMENIPTGTWELRSIHRELEETRVPVSLSAGEAREVNVTIREAVNLTWVVHAEGITEVEDLPFKQLRMSSPRYPDLSWSHGPFQWWKKEDGVFTKRAAGNLEGEFRFVCSAQAYEPVEVVRQASFGEPQEVHITLKRKASELTE